MSNIYQDEANALNRKGRSGGSKAKGSDFAWLAIEKPERVHAKSKRRIRIVQQLPWVDGPDGRMPDVENPMAHFWARVPVHSAQSGAQWTRLNCPENPDIDGWRDNCQCPMCVLQKELWDTKMDEYAGVAKLVGFRWRIYYNVIDLDDPASHWVQQDDGSYLIRPFIWSCSRGVHGEVIEACISHGPVEDLQVGHDLTIVCKRIGPADNEIRYSIECMERPTPLDTRLIPVAQRAFDLRGLRKPASIEDLRKMAESLDPRDRSVRPTPRMPAAPPAPPARVAPPPPTGPADDGPHDVVYHVSDGGVQLHQPKTADQIVEYLINGQKFPPALQVWAPGMEDWIAASDVQQIDSAFRKSYDALKPSVRPPDPPPRTAPPPPPPTRAAPPPPQQASQAPGGPPASYRPAGGYPVAPEPPTAPMRPSQPGPPPPPGNGGKPPGGPPSF